MITSQPNAMDGGSFQISCSNATILPSTIQLVLNGSVVNISSSDRISASLNESQSVVLFTINPVRLEDNGTVARCVVEGSNQSSEEITISIGKLKKSMYVEHT